jgi:predicted CoA-binding protein
MDERERARIRAAIDAAEGRGGAPQPTDVQLREMLGSSRTIAVVGASPKPDRPSHHVLLALQAAGWSILPVNPAGAALATGVAGLTCFPDLASAAASLPAGERIGLVDVFRRAEDCAAVTRDAIAVGARGVWLQLGIVSEDAADLAAAAGIPFVQDRCTAIEMLRLGVKGPRPDSA